jgi:hypothetical protein
MSTILNKVDTSSIYCQTVSVISIVENNLNIIILVNDQLDALFLNVFISCFYMFRAANAHHQEGQIVLIRHLV